MVNESGDIYVTDSTSMLLGMELATSDGRCYIVVRITSDGLITIARSTWWRRLYWRIRRLFV